MTDLERRRAAMSLAAQLPKDKQDRRAVVNYMRELCPFLDGQDETGPPRAPDIPEQRT